MVDYVSAAIAVGSEGASEVLTARMIGVDGVRRTIKELSSEWP